MNDTIIVELDHADPWERINAILAGYGSIFEDGRDIALHQLAVDLFLTLETDKVNQRQFLEGVLETLAHTDQEDPDKQLRRILGK